MAITYRAGIIGAAITALVSALMWFNARGADVALKTSYNDGTLKNDNTEKKEAEAQV